MLMRLLRTGLQVGGLFLFYEVGTWIQRALNLVIPGSLIGMALLFLLLISGWVPDSFLEEGSNLLLGYLPLLFIPAVTGVVDYLPFVMNYGVPLAVIVLVNTLLVMASSAYVSQWLAKRKEVER